MILLATNASANALVLESWMVMPRSPEANKWAGLRLDRSEPFSRSVVAELKKIRLAKGISQKTLAERAGLSRSAVIHIEAGIRNPTLIVCHALVDSLGISLATVIRRIDRSRG